MRGAKRHACWQQCYARSAISPVVSKVSVRTANKWKRVGRGMCLSSQGIGGVELALDTFPVSAASKVQGSARDLFRGASQSRTFQAWTAPRFRLSHSRPHLFQPHVDMWHVQSPDADGNAVKVHEKSCKTSTAPSPTAISTSERVRMELLSTTKVQQPNISSVFITVVPMSTTQGLHLSRAGMSLAGLHI